MRKPALSIALSLMTALGLSACHAAYQDLEDLDVIDPDKAVIVRNADQFPNLAILCFEGTAVITTTREAAPVIDRDSVFCREGEE